jgi:hypothetical protein
MAGKVVPASPPVSQLREQGAAERPSRGVGKFDHHDGVVVGTSGRQYCRFYARDDVLGRSPLREERGELALRQHCVHAVRGEDEPVPGPESAPSARVATPVSPPKPSATA